MEFHFLLFLLSFGTFLRMTDSLPGCNTKVTTLGKLKNDIFCDYDYHLRPVKHQSNKTIVSMHLYPRQIDFEEDRNLLYVDSWIDMSWKDASLTWDPKDYDNIRYIHVPQYMVWVPDLSVYNKMDLDVNTDSNPAVVMNNGMVYTVVMTDFSAHCNMDLTYWPNDEHTCTATMGSRSYTGFHLDFNFNEKTAVYMKNYYPSKLWILKSITANRKVIDLGSKNDSMYLVTMNYQITVKRHSTFIIATVFVPVILLSVMTLMPLLLPFASNRCYTTLVLSAAGQIYYLHYFGMILPHNAENSILIVAYVRDSLVMTIFALIMCVWMDQLTNTTELPIWLCNLLKNVQSARYTRMLPIPQKNLKENIEEDAINLVNPEGLCTSKDWSILLLILQRFIFIIYVIIYMVMLIAFLY